MRTITLSVLLTSVFALFAACGMLGPKKVFQTEDDLRREYKKSESEFKAKYDGKEVSAAGRAGSVAMAGEAGGIVYFETNTHESVSGAPSIACYVGSDGASRFNELKVEKGTLMRVKGKMKVEALTMRLEDCKLEQVGPSALSGE